MTETLIRQKILYPYRLMETYSVVAVDGTGVLVYNQRHCPYCLSACGDAQAGLTRVRDGKTVYYHNVLEAKLVTPNGVAFSLMTEFIENPGENPTKQDCELKAFYRLAARLEKRFLRLPILMTMDGLFAGGPTFEKSVHSGFGSVKNLSFRILEAWRNARLTNFDFRAILYTHFRIRFDSDSS